MQRREKNLSRLQAHLHNLPLAVIPHGPVDIPVAIDDTHAGMGTL
jgi:hypothetical protein